jgi:hypothetical protein
MRSTERPNSLSSRTNDLGLGSREISKSPTLARSRAIALTGRAMRDDMMMPRTMARSVDTTAIPPAIIASL